MADADSGNVYVLSCQDSVITFFLVKDHAIVAFSTIDKDGKKVFLLL